MMMMKQQAAAAALFGILIAAEGEAFSTSTASLRQKTFSTSLNLIPDQGNQLAAAYNAAHSDDDDVNNNNNNNKMKTQQESSAAPIEAKDDNNVDESSHWRAVAASKSFLTRIFHKPSGSSKHTPSEEGDNEYSNNNHNTDEGEDVVYYPMIGFTYFEGIENALSTVSHQTCTMPTKSQKEEEVFGWFSSSCQLDLFSEDVCHTPTVSSSSSSSSILSPEEE